MLDKVRDLNIPRTASPLISMSVNMRLYPLICMVFGAVVGGSSTFVFQGITKAPFCGLTRFSMLNCNH